MPIKQHGYCEHVFWGCESFHLVKIGPQKSEGSDKTELQEKGLAQQKNIR